jgi:hypothetical protein
MPTPRTEHDPLCPWYPDDASLTFFGCQCDPIARVRADERERTNTVRGHRRIGAEARDDLLSDLRESVAALEDVGCARVLGGCDCRRSEALRDVLALLDGHA